MLTACICFCRLDCNQLVDIYNTFCKALDDGLEVPAVFCDRNKAFDRVWHKGLLFKLKMAGINELLLDWLTDYLTELLFQAEPLIGSLLKLAYPKVPFWDHFCFYCILMTLFSIYSHVFDLLLMITACT